MPVAEYIRQLWISGSILVRPEPFSLKSGRESHVYVNHRHIICLPRHLEAFSSALVTKARTSYPAPFAIANVDSSVSPFLVAASALSYGIPFYNFRALSREKGVRAELFRYDELQEPDFAPSLPAVLVDDVVTTMSTAELSARVLRDNDVAVLGVVCMLDRRVRSDIEKAELPILSVATLTETLSYGLEHGHVVAGQQQLVEIELNALES
jgi:orotate phosphoribosyltransferase